MTNERLNWFNRGKIDPIILRYGEDIGHCYFCSAIFTTKNEKVVLPIPVYPSERFYIAGHFVCCKACADQVQQDFVVKTTCPLCGETYPVTESELDFRGDADYMCPDCVYSFYGKKILARNHVGNCDDCDTPFFFDVSLVEQRCNFCREYGIPLVKYSEQFPAVIYQGSYGRRLVLYEKDAYKSYAITDNGNIFTAVLRLLWSQK